MDPTPIHVTPRCPVRTTWELLGGKWRSLLLHQVSDGQARRFSELKQLLPDISEKMLMQELQQLVAAGLLLRSPQMQIPFRVAYTITPLGQQALPVIAAAAAFGQAYEEYLRGEAEAANSRSLV